MVVFRRTKVTMLLANHAQAADGMLNIIGGGWTVTGPDPHPFAIAMMVEFPWDAIGEPHNFKLELIDSDGAPVYVPKPPDGQEGPLVVQGEMNLAPHPNTRAGTPLAFPVAINFAPQPIPPGGRYEWRVEVDGETHEDWRVGFNTRPAAGQQTG